MCVWVEGKKPLRICLEKTVKYSSAPQRIKGNCLECFGRSRTKTISEMKPNPKKENISAEREEEDEGEEEEEEEEEEEPF
jgi:hypothetical protein